MDYKYIEQLLERYWQCDTSVEEEAILRFFFSQSSIPSYLMPYKKLFSEERQLQKAQLSADFDERLLSQIQTQEKIKAKKTTWTNRLMPLYKAVASIAIILTLGNAAQSSFRQADETIQSDYNYESYEDSYKDPQTAYNQVSEALQMVSQRLSDTIQEDTVRQESTANKMQK